MIKEVLVKGTSINLLRSPIAASHARSLLAYPLLGGVARSAGVGLPPWRGAPKGRGGYLDMSRRSLRGSLPSGLLVTISRSA